MIKRYNRYHLVVIGDYNDNDAHGIVQDNLYYWFEQQDLSILGFDRVDVKPFNTMETGYMLARRALNPLSPSARQVFFVNTAPRMDDFKARATNQGEGFVEVTLKNGKRIYGVDSGFALSFIKPQIQSLYKLNVPDSAEDIPMLAEALGREGGGNIGAGQFRSGYIYPIVAAMALAGFDNPISPKFSALYGDAVDPAALPDIPDDVIVFRDGYGNFKTSIRPDALAQQVGEFAVISSQGAEIIAHVRAGIFDVPLHHFSFAPGSTILAYADGTRRQFTEVVLRGGHAARAFARTIGGRSVSPVEGDAISWRLATSSDFDRLGYGADGKPPQDVLAAATRS